MQNEQDVAFFPAEPSRARDLIELQTAVLEAAANAVVITDQTGTVIWVNSAFAQLTGNTPAHIGGQSTRLLKSSRNPPALYEEMWQTILGAKIWRGELINRRKDVSLYDGEMIITPVQDRKGDITDYIAIKLNIPERQRAEKELHDSESKHRVLFEESADAHLLTDETGFLDCNAATLQMFGYATRADFTALHPADLSPPNQLDGTPSRVAASQKIATAFLNGKERFEWLHKRKDGEIFPAEVCLTALTLNGRRARGPSPAQIEVAMVSVVITSGKNEKQPLIGDQQ